MKVILNFSPNFDAKKRKKSDIKFIVISNSPSKISIPRNEIGNPKATQKASLMFRNRERKIRTNNIPNPPFSSKRFVL